MSHQTGIGASEELRQFFASAKDGSVRMIKVSIENEKLVLNTSAAAQGTWEEDYDALVLPALEAAQPCYVMYRLDVKSNTEYQWLYIVFSPDNSPVRQKMLYAATRATLKMEFGGGQVRDELFGTAPHEVSLVGYKKHVVTQASPAPLTMAEEELEMVKKNEVRADVSVDTKHQTMTGLLFPISDDALAKLQELAAGSLDYVQLSLDIAKETINLAHYENIEVESLPPLVPTDHARYHFFRFKHTFEGDYLNTIVFIYSMPTNKCSIKERMLYSSCKGPLLEVMEQNLGMEIPRKIELDDPKEITEAFLQEELHPKRDIVRAKFSRPKGPGGRGPKRMIKPKADEQPAD